MAALYTKALKNTDDAIAVKQSQRDWLRLVRNQCTTVDCLSTVYARRIDALNSGRALELDPSISALKAVDPSVDANVQYLPASQTYKLYSDWLAQNHLFESSLALARTVAPGVPMPKVVGWECDTNRAAFYLSQSNLVVVCYQFVAQIANFHAGRLQDSSTNTAVEGRRMFTALEFAVLHEIGHSLLHRRKALGSLGPEEAEADTFASVILLSNMPQLNDIVEATISIWGLTSTFGTKQETTWEDYSDEHALPGQRFDNFACLALGRNPAFGPWIAKANILTAHRAQRCAAEWDRASIGMRTLVAATR